MALSKFEMELYKDKISFSSILDYGLEKVPKATSINIIKGIIGGPNMKYKAVEVQQSHYIYHVMQSNLITICEKTKCKILFMEHSDNFDGILTVTLKPKSQKSREHLILWGCYRMTMETIPEVGFARAFDLTGGKHICLHFNIYSLHTKKC